MTGCSARTDRLRSLLVAVLGAAVLVAALAVALARPAYGASIHTVARGLDNPRGLAFLPNGRLAVAEGGHAGAVCLGPGECGGLTGRVVAITLRTGRRTTLATGFPSIGFPFAPFGLGGLAVQRGRLFAVVGENPQEFGDPVADCHGQPHADACAALLRTAIARVGTLVQVRSLRADRGWRTIAGVGRFDFTYTVAHPAHGSGPDADPFGLLAGPAGGFYVVDGASNTLDRVSASGRISVLAPIPGPPNDSPIPDAAPTCAAPLPHGGVVIGTESGVLWRWRSHHLSRLLVAGKIGQVVGCVADARGDVYVANMDARLVDFIGFPGTGSIVKVTPHLRTSYVARRLNYPTGITWGPDGALYVTDDGLCPADLSLVATPPARPHACPSAGRILRVALPGALGTASPAPK